MTVRFIPELAGLTPYQPGLPIEAVQRRFGLDRVVKLASNEFPLPPFPEVKEAVMGALDRLQRYPDGFSTDLREALAAVYDRSPEQITIGCGTCELLYLLAHAVLERGDEVVLAAAVVHVLPRRHRHPRRRARGRARFGTSRTISRPWRRPSRRARR